MTVKALRPDVPLAHPNEVEHRRLIAMRANTSITDPLPFHIVSELPDPSTRRGSIIYVTDESGGEVPAFSDGTNWRRVTDRAVVS